MITPWGSPYISQYDSTYDTFGTLSLTDPAQTFTEPMVLDEVKSYLRVDTDMTDDDALLTSLITAAREQAEIAQNRDLVVKQYDLHYDYWPSFRIQLRAPLVSVDLVTYMEIDGTTHTMTSGPDADYVVDTSKQPGLITPTWNASWPSFTPFTAGAITIRFTSGYSPDSNYWSDTGARVKIGMLMLIASWYQRRLPFASVRGGVAEYPYAVTSCLNHGALERAR